VPIAASHVEFEGNRTWKNRGETCSGSEIIHTDTEDGQTVVYLRSMGDFRQLIQNTRNGLDWQQLNPHLMQRLADIAPRKHAPIPEAPQRPYY
jgi:hypothetical protein